MAGAALCGQVWCSKWQDRVLLQHTEVSDVAVVWLVVHREAELLQRQLLLR